jgi:hypothetical protein
VLKEHRGMLVKINDLTGYGFLKGDFPSVNHTLDPGAIDVV